MPRLRTEIRKQHRAIHGRNPEPILTPHGRSLVAAMLVNKGPFDPQWDKVQPKIGALRLELCANA